MATGTGTAMEKMELTGSYTTFSAFLMLLLNNKI
jgi:hypothetical protein